MNNKHPIRSLLPLLLAVSLTSAVCYPAARGGRDPQLEKISLPDGFEIDIFAKDVPQVRSLTLNGEGNIVYAGTRGSDKVYAFPDKDQDGVADTVLIVADGLDTPNGVAWRDGDLYVGEVSRILRYKDVDEKAGEVIAPVIIRDDLPEETHHGWKYIAFGPDGKLYVPVGAPCNVCDRPEDPRFASILRMNADGSEMEVYASGVRNTVGFDWHPQTKELWFTENGRDWLGDEGPCDELNHAPRAGMHFGFPWCHCGDTPDPKLNEGRDCAEFTTPAQALGPHVAALGMKFYTGDMFPAEYRNAVFIAEHGSWNRSQPIGYRVSLVRMNDSGNPESYEVFAEGWLENNKAWGRPVDILQLPDGSLLLSDDYGGRIYRIHYAP